MPRGSNPASIAALRRHGPRPGEVRNPHGLNGTESTRAIRSAFYEALEMRRRDGRTVREELVDRAIGFALEGSARELFALLQFVAPPSQRIEADVEVRQEESADVEELAEKLRALAERRRRHEAAKAEGRIKRC